MSSCRERQERERDRDTPNSPSIFAAPGVLAGRTFHHTTTAEVKSKLHISRFLHSANYTIWLQVSSAVRRNEHSVNRSG